MAEAKLLGHRRSAKIQETDVQNLKVGWHVWFMKDFVSRFSVNPQDMSVEKKNPLVQYSKIASCKIRCEVETIHLQLHVSDAVSASHVTVIWWACNTEFIIFPAMLVFFLEMVVFNLKIKRDG